MPIQYFVVFINPEFTLYLPKPHKSIILPTQVNPFIRKLAATPAKLTASDKKLADLLMSLHKEEDPYSRLTFYDFSILEKGIVSSCCRSLAIVISDGFCTCTKCGYKEEIDSAVLRSIEELRLLFPDLIITTIGVYQWCGETVSKKTIRRVLKQSSNTFINKRRWSYFE
ncbi:hypothetical protein [Neobacillus dielmonensis]|uniref:hypothetical protein n=1 Tax=Neobacillus dielmonensis TaxID=1347369 RepID=UPI0006950023|nr:hypothetical protein [Neobacillus dielmonensis]